MFETGLKDQAAIITGAGRGIGFEIARQLAIRGAKVMINDQDEPIAREACAEISRFGTCEYIVGDASDALFIAAMVEKAVQSFGRLDIAVANAGITVYGEFLDFTIDSFETIVNLNLRGSFFLAQAAAKQFIRQSSGGSILLMSSVTAHQAHRNLAAYGMTKAGLEMLAKSLVVELAPYQIRVNAIAPGATITERTNADETYVNTWNNITPLGKPASVDDIANAALFLLSPASGHITGQTIIVDGGWTSVSPQPV